MRIALVTCEKMPEGSPDDRLLLDALIADGQEAKYEIWTEPSADWKSYDLALLRSPWDYYLKLPAFLAWAASTSAVTHLANSLGTVRENAHKEYLLDLGQRGLPIVPSFIAQDRLTAEVAGKQMLKDGPIIVKPTISGGSFLTFLVREESELAPALLKVLAHSEALLQPFVESISTDGEISLIYFRIGGEWRYSHSVLKTAAPKDFRVQTNFNGRVESFEPSKRTFSLAAEILKRLSPHDLYVRIDLVDWKTSPKIGEIELIEPALFFGFSKNAAVLQIQAIESSFKAGKK